MTRRGYAHRTKDGFLVGAKDDDGDYDGPAARVSLDDTWLEICTDDYEGNAMLNKEALGPLIDALCALRDEASPSGNMSYDYVRRTYGVDPQVGQRVRHTEIDRLGTVARENKSASHYVYVKLDGQNFASPCHPRALEYILPPPSEEQTHQGGSSD